MYFGPLKAYSPLTQPHLDAARRMPARKYRKARNALALMFWTLRRIEGNELARYYHKGQIITTGPAAKKKTAELEEEAAGIGAFRRPWM